MPHIFILTSCVKGDIGDIIFVTILFFTVNLLVGLRQLKFTRNVFHIYAYSQLSLNRHLYKTDTSIRWTPGAGPGHFSVILL